MSAGESIADAVEREVYEEVSVPNDDEVLAPPPTTRGAEGNPSTKSFASGAGCVQQSRGLLNPGEYSITLIIKSYLNRS